MKGKNILLLIVLALLFIHFWFIDLSTASPKKRGKRPSQPPKRVEKLAKKVLSKTPKGRVSKIRSLRDSSSSTLETYRVKRGDNLFRIAKKFGFTVEELRQLNGLNGKELKTGQILIIQKKLADQPQQEFSSKLDLPSNNTEPFNIREEEKGSDFVNHVVRKGDTLFSLSKRYRISIGELMEVNQLEGPSLKEGQILKIPAKREFGRWASSDESQVLPTFNLNETPEPGPEDTVTLAMNPEKTRVFHLVKKGETLALLAQKYGTTPQAIKSLNRLKRNRLRPGQKILVKVEAQEGVRLKSSLRRNFFMSYPVGPYLIHRVKEGETLFRLSLLYGVPIEELKSINNLSDNIIIVGQDLKVPVLRVEGNKLTDPGLVFKSTEEPLAKKFGSFTQESSFSQSLRDKFLEISTAYSEARYRLGGEGNGVLDCSAFVQKVYKQIGVELPRSSFQQFQVGEEVSPSNLLPGDLVFFRTSKRAPVTHVGIYLGDNKFIHVSSRRKGLSIDSLEDSYYKIRFVGAKRILNGEVLHYFQEYLLKANEELKPNYQQSEDKTKEQIEPIF